MSSDFLADLDAAVEQWCACRCGASITAASPSAYFASESCAERWHRPAWVALPQVAIRVDTASVATALQQLVAALNRAMRALAEALSPLVEQARRLVQQLRPLLADAPSDDPRERALWLLRHRNTGPRPPARPLRQMCPPGGFHADARGRPAYRPFR